MIRPKSFNIAEAKARLPELVQRAADGEEIIIARNGRPQARLVALPTSRPRVPGKGAGEWQVPEDFNESLPPEILERFEGTAE